MTSKNQQQCKKEAKSMKFKTTLNKTQNKNNFKYKNTTKTFADLTTKCLFGN